MLGEAYRIKGKWQPAAHYYERYLRGYPDALDIRLALIEMVARLEDPKRLRQHVFAAMDQGGGNEKSPPLAVKDLLISEEIFSSDRKRLLTSAFEETLKHEIENLEEVQDLPVWCAAEAKEVRLKGLLHAFREK